MIDRTLWDLKLPPGTARCLRALSARCGGRVGLGGRFRRFAVSSAVGEVASL